LTQVTAALRWTTGEGVCEVKQKASARPASVKVKIEGNACAAMFSFIAHRSLDEHMMQSESLKARAGACRGLRLLDFCKKNIFMINDGVRHRGVAKPLS
jgi:hypothetical protein